MGEVVGQVVAPLVPDDRLDRLAGDEEGNEDFDESGLSLGADAAGDEAGEGLGGVAGRGSLACLPCGSLESCTLA